MREYMYMAIGIDLKIAFYDTDYSIRAEVYTYTTQQSSVERKHALIYNAQRIYILYEVKLQK